MFSHFYVFHYFLNIIFLSKINKKVCICLFSFLILCQFYLIPSRWILLKVCCRLIKDLFIFERMILFRRGIVTQIIFNCLTDYIQRDIKKNRFQKINEINKIKQCFWWITTLKSNASVNVFDWISRRNKTFLSSSACCHINY